MTVHGRTLLVGPKRHSTSRYITAAWASGLIVRTLSFSVLSITLICFSEMQQPRSIG